MGVTTLLGLSYEIQFRNVWKMLQLMICPVKSKGWLLAYGKTEMGNWSDWKLWEWYKSSSCHFTIKHSSYRKPRGYIATRDLAPLRENMGGRNSELRHKLVSKFHTSSWGVHSGANATYQRIKIVFYWPKPVWCVKELVRNYEIFQQNKDESVAYPDLLQPLPIPSWAWEHVAMDFISGLPKSQGKDSILVVIDRYSKYAHFSTLTHPYTTRQNAQMFLNNVSKLHDIPCSIVLDRDPIFMSDF